MPTSRFLVYSATDGTLKRTNTLKSSQTILKELSTDEAVYMDNGYSDDPAFGSLTLRFGANEIASIIGSGSKIDSCKFGMYCANFNSSEYYSTANMKLNGSPLVNMGYSEYGVWKSWENSFVKNPLTSTEWKISDFNSDITLYIETNGAYATKVAYVWLDVTYTSHEVLKPSIATQRIKVPTGIMDLPIFNPSDVSYPALRIGTPKGVGAFSLVDISDAYASPIRIKTPKGIKAIAYKK